ncbi:MAG: hypothetical protein IBJ10_10545 [Phycisphaerales bacterium]|nr:hypothetical protein [Phycisphaerales bacterium]
MNEPSPSPIITLEPAPKRWADLLRTAPARPEATPLRAALGLPTDRPVVMTGHQAEFWHAGILAKHIAACALADGAGAYAAHIVVDSDETDPGAVRMPRSSDDELSAHVVHLLPTPPAGTPPACLPPAPPARHEAPPTLPSVVEGLAAIALALRRHAGAASLGAQMGLALTELMRPWAPLPAPVFSSRLSGTAAFRAIVERMAQDPGACVRAHNAAALAVPEARVAPLAERRDGAARWELPLWRLRPGRARARVFADQLGDIPAEELAPRALLLTGFLRLYACDLFIHGAGGAVYDRITDRWLPEWLGALPAPTAMASATLTLPLQPGSTPSVADIDRAAWTSHHARHDPSLVGDEPGAREKASIVERIRAARSAGQGALPLYRELQAFLTDYRRRHADAIERLHAQALSFSAARARAALAADRTWPFPLHDARALDALAARVRKEFP